MTRWINADRKDRFGIPRSKAAEYSQSVIPTAVRTHSQQTGRCTQHATAGDVDAGTTMLGIKMDQCLGVNGRPVL